MADFSPQLLLDGLRAAHPAPPARYWVAFSGGLDSTVLLHAMAERRADLGAPLAAVHVNHNLQPQAAEWQRHCAEACAALDIPFECFSVTVRAADGESVEAAARESRYHAFGELLAADECLLTAHHQDDQLETFLLQAFRGAGPHGLAAMPRQAPFGRGRLCRPLLDFSRAELEAWARARGLEWLDDPSNAEARFDRNFLRLEILPALRQRWPQLAATVSRSARHCAEAAWLLDEMAALDLAETGVEGAIRVVALRRLDPPRQRNLVRHWLAWQGFPRPSEKKLEHVLSDVLDAAPDREPCVDWADVAVRRYRGMLYADRRLAAPRTGAWQGGRFALGEGWGELERVAADTGLPEGEVEIRLRAGGERLRLPGRQHHHSVRKLFQEAGVLPWMRDALPFIHVNGELAAVGDLWLNADLLRPRGWRPQWRGRPRILEISPP